MPLAAKIESVLLETGDFDRAKAIFAKAVEENYFNQDGVVHFSEKLACIEYLHLADLGYEEYQPKKVTERKTK